MSLGAFNRYNLIMCYAKPGPRCDKSAMAALRSAQQKYDEKPTAETEAKLQEAMKDYSITNDNIDKLFMSGEDESAKHFTALREKMIEDSKLIQHRTTGKWGDIPLKEMDPSALTHAIEEVLSRDDGSINWGTSSVEEFHDSMMYASYLHRDQTRANRANLPRTPYIEHPLRNTLRLMRWGETDGEVLTASILHDTIEDCADKISERPELSPEQQRAISIQKMNDRYGTEVGSILVGVSNDIMPAGTPKQEKVKNYLKHFSQSIKDPKVMVVKVADLYDNAAGLHHNFIDGQYKMVKHLHKKYTAAVAILKHQYDQSENNVEGINQDYLREKILSIESNLERLGKSLKQYEAENNL